MADTINGEGKPDKRYPPAPKPAPPPPPPPQKKAEWRELEGVLCFMRKEAVFSIRDLRHVSIACPHCGTLVTLDMARYERKIPPRAGDRRSFTPIQCPACQVPYDSALTALDELQHAYAELSKLGEAVTFHAEDEEDARKDVHER